MARRRTPTLLPVLLAMALAAPIVVVASTAEAQIIVDDGKKKKKKRKKKGKVECADGKAVSADTRGECCYPGQAWNGSACVGAPTECPEGLESSEAHDSCVAPGCEDGMVLADENHCCWPNQAWSVERSLCIGRPECPEGLEADGVTCVAPAPVEVVKETPPVEKEPETETPVPVDPLPPTDEGTSGAAIAGWVLIGVGVAAGGGGAVLQVVAEGKRDEIRDASRTTLSSGESAVSGLTQSEAETLSDEANVMGVAGWATIGVGGAALITGIILVATSSGESSESDPTAGLSWTGDGVLATFGGRF